MISDSEIDVITPRAPARPMSRWSARVSSRRPPAPT